jgi:hypothetical protein
MWICSESFPDLQRQNRKREAWQRFKKIFNQGGEEKTF